MLYTFKMFDGATEHSFLTKMKSHDNKKFILGIYDRWIERPSIAKDPTFSIELSKVPKFSTDAVIAESQKRDLLDEKTKPENVKAFVEHWFEKGTADFPLEFEAVKKRFNIHQKKMLGLDFATCTFTSSRLIRHKRPRVVPAHIDKRVRRCFEVKDAISGRKFKVVLDGVITQKWEASETDHGRPLWTIKYRHAHVKNGKHTYVIESDEEDLNEDEVQKGLVASHMEMAAKDMESVTVQPAVSHEEDDEEKDDENEAEDLEDLEEEEIDSLFRTVISELD